MRPGDFVRQLRVLLDSVLVEFEDFSKYCPIAVPYMNLFNSLKSVTEGETPNFKSMFY
jgi:hypothetical protein